MIRGEGDPALIDANGTLHLERALKSLAGADRNVIKAALKDIGEMLLNSHRERWKKAVSPAGEEWAPLSEAYRARKEGKLQAKAKKNRKKAAAESSGDSGRVLVLDGNLRDTLRYQVKRASLEFGTNLIYGATHQFGAPDRGIPARPFLGMSAADEEQVQAIIADHLSRALGG